MVLTTKIGLFINTFFSKLLSFLNGFSCRCQIDLKLKIIQCSSLQLFTSVCPSVHPSVCLSICLSVFPSICPWFHIPQWWLSIGERILHPFLCQMPKLAFASQLLITYFRLGMTLLCLVLIVKHGKRFWHHDSILWPGNQLSQKLPQTSNLWHDFQITLLKTVFHLFPWIYMKLSITSLASVA